MLGQQSISKRSGTICNFSQENHCFVLQHSHISWCVALCEWSTQSISVICFRWNSAAKVTSGHLLSLCGKFWRLAENFHLLDSPTKKWSKMRGTSFKTMVTSRIWKDRHPVHERYSTWWWSAGTTRRHTDQPFMKFTCFCSEKTWDIIQGRNCPVTGMSSKDTFSKRFTLEQRTWASYMKCQRRTVSSYMPGTVY